MAVLHPRFDFHPKCKAIILSHLCFADNIFLFAKGNATSVQITMDELAKFETFSGLQVNKQKIVVFLDGINDSVLLSLA